MATDRMGTVQDMAVQVPLEVFLRGVQEAGLQVHAATSTGRGYDVCDTEGTVIYGNLALLPSLSMARLTPVLKACQGAGYPITLPGVGASPDPGSAEGVVQTALGVETGKEDHVAHELVGLRALIESEIDGGAQETDRILRLIRLYAPPFDVVEVDGQQHIRRVEISQFLEWVAVHDGISREVETPGLPRDVRELPDVFAHVRFRVQSMEIREFDGDSARELLLATNAYVGQRSYSPRNLEELTGQARRNLLFPGFVVLGRLPAGAPRLVDGQHWLQVVAQENCRLRATVLTIEVPDKVSFWYLAARFNRRGAVKSRGHFSETAARVSGLDARINIKHAAAFSDALTNFRFLVDRETGRYRTSKARIRDDDRYGIFFEQRVIEELAEWWDAMFSRGLSSDKRILKQATRIAMIWHWHVDPEAASTFWASILFGGGGGFVEDPDPARKDIRALLQTFLRVYGSPETMAQNVKRASREEFFYTINWVWNVWRKDNRSTRRVLKIRKEPTVPR